MALDIQQFPKGLAALLNLKQGGVTPRVLSDVVAGTIDVGAMYMLNNREQSAILQQNAPVVGANGFATNLTVPNNELWYVWTYFVAATCGAGQVASVQPSCNVDGLSTSVPLGIAGAYVDVAANEEGRTQSQQFWAGPGSGFSFLARRITGAPVIQAAVLFTRLRV